MYQPYLLGPIRFCGSNGGLRGLPKDIKEGFISDPIYHLLLGIFRGHMPKLRPKSQYLSEISGFFNFAKSKFRITLTNEKLSYLAGF